ncbi:hypothetical protein [Chromobacterium vaccinii]|uniref:hypothetical protein n=1 Tax=Chromobacterium vaccinii TaxID=1108595 RepID=UPI0031D15EE7
MAQQISDKPVRYEHAARPAQINAAPDRHARSASRAKCGRASKTLQRLIHHNKRPGGNTLRANVLQ